MIFPRNESAKVRRLQKQVADLTAELEAKDRVIQILETERDTMSAVIARDRQRVQAESAALARSRAEAEGIGDDHQ